MIFLFSALSSFVESVTRETPAILLQIRTREMSVGTQYIGNRVRFVSFFSYSVV